MDILIKNQSVWNQYELFNNTNTLDKYISWFAETIHPVKIENQKVMGKNTFYNSKK